LSIFYKTAPIPQKLSLRRMSMLHNTYGNFAQHHAFAIHSEVRPHDIPEQADSIFHISQQQKIMTTSRFCQEQLQTANDKLPFKPRRRESYYEVDLNDSNHYQQEEQALVGSNVKQRAPQPQQRRRRPRKSLDIVADRCAPIKIDTSKFRASLFDCGLRPPQREDSLETLPPIQRVLLQVSPAYLDETRLALPKRRESDEFSGGLHRNSSISALSMSWLNKSSISIDLNTIEESNASGLDFLAPKK
jgi:hypothetical protein